jgi:hypothetical protein
MIKESIEGGREGYAAMRLFQIAGEGLRCRDAELFVSPRSRFKEPNGGSKGKSVMAYSRSVSVCSYPDDMSDIGSEPPEREL